jgi:putative hydrolase of the HAD superfamily
VLSNGPQHYIEGLLQKMDIRQQFAACYGMEKMRFRPKPDRRGFRCMLQAERLDPSHCIMVEDSLLNLQPNHWACVPYGSAVDAANPLLSMCGSTN